MKKKTALITGQGRLNQWMGLPTQEGPNSRTDREDMAGLEDTTSASHSPTTPAQEPDPRVTEAPRVAAQASIDIAVWTSTNTDETSLSPDTSSDTPPNQQITQRQVVVHQTLRHAPKRSRSSTIVLGVRSKKPKKIYKFSDRFHQLGFIKSDKKDENNLDLGECYICGTGYLHKNSCLKKNHLENHFNKEHGGSKVWTYKKRKDEMLKYKLLKKFEASNGLESKGFTSKQLLHYAQLQIVDLMVRVKAPHRYGEILVKPSLELAGRILFGDAAEKTMSMLVLNRTDVAKSISVLSEDIKAQVIAEILASDLPVAIQIDETTDKGKCAQVMAFVRYLSKDDEGLYFLKQNILFCHQLPGRATSAEIMKLLEKALSQYGIPWSKVGSVCADGARTMQGDISGLKALLGQKNKKIETNNCLVHKFSLVCKTPLQIKLRRVKKIAVDVITYIRGRRTIFNEFKKFCVAKKAPFKQLLYFNHVRWLSMGQCLVRLMKMMKYVREFLVKRHHRHAGFFFSNVFLGQLAYLTDIHVLMNDVNVYLQGENMTRPDAIDAILQFKREIIARKQCVEENIFDDFPGVAKVLKKDFFKRRYLKKYDIQLSNVNLLTAIKSEVLKHFEDILTAFEEKFTIKDKETGEIKEDILKYNKWLVDPFSDQALQDCTSNTTKRDLIHIRNDPAMKTMFEQRDNITSFWCNMMHFRPKIARKALKQLLQFATTVEVERGFSGLNDLKTTNRQRLKNMDDETRVSLSHIRPRFDDLVEAKFQQNSN